LNGDYSEMIKIYLAEVNEVQKNLHFGLVNCLASFILL